MLLRNLSNLLGRLGQNGSITSNSCTQSVRRLRHLPRPREETRTLALSNSTQRTQDLHPAQHAIIPKTSFEAKDTERPERISETGHLPTDSCDYKDDDVAVVKNKHDYVPTFNLAAYVNKSSTLQQLMHLGVDLSKIERRKGLAEFVLRLNFEENVKPHLLFLQDQGVSPDVFGHLITKNPLLFKVEMDDLQTRVNYLEAKKFTSEQRQRIFTHNPYWLMFSTRRIDRRLGHFQMEFRLSGDDVRFLATKLPRLITYKMDHIRKSTFCIREEMGFDADELKCLLLRKPRLWMLKSDSLIERFAYAHEQMKLSHDMLLQFPEVLTSREFRLRDRHEFLQLLGRAQYDPEKDLYVSPRNVVNGTDHDFVTNIAKTDMKTYELFLKTR